jgi:hypothetical protein
MFFRQTFTEGKTVKVTRYDGNERLPKEVQPDLGGEKLPDQGQLFIGTKVMMLPHFTRAIVPRKDFEGNVPATENDHWQHRGGVSGNGKTAANFDYAGPLTEAVLLGSVATRFLTRPWSGTRRSQFANLSEANQYVRRQYRKG